MKCPAPANPVQPAKSCRRSPSLPARKRKQPRGVIDTSVLIAGIAGLKPAEIASQNASARMLRDWVENGTFIWLVTEEIILEYKTVLARLGVRRSTIGRVINLLSEEGELIPISSEARISPDPGDDPFCQCSEQGAADFLVTLNPRDFPQR